METSPVSQDDILDVKEMTQKLETYICSIFRDSEPNLAMSALMSATINCIIVNCKTVDEIELYKDIFMHIFDSVIKPENIS